MLGFCVPVPSLSGRSASLRVLPERAAGRFLKHLIWRILLVIRRPVSGVESIFLPGLREGRSKPAGLVDEVAQRLAGEETAAVVEDDLVVDETVGWARLLRVQGEVRELADFAGEDPLQGAADRYLTLRKFAPELIEALEFKAARTHDPILSAIRLLRDLNHSGKRDIPVDAPSPFRKDWKRLISEQGQPNRRLYETAVFATLRDRPRGHLGSALTFRRRTVGRPPPDRAFRFAFRGLFLG